LSRKKDVLINEKIKAKMIKNKLYILLFLTMVKSMIAMDNTFFIENPFTQKKENDIQLSLDLLVTQENRHSFLRC